MSQTACYSHPPAGDPPDDSAYLQIKLDLALAARRWRRRSKVSRGELAEQLELGPSGPARLEVDDPAVTLDLLVRSLLLLGATRRDIALEIVRST